MKNLIGLAQDAQAYDLAQPYFIGMPHHPAHPPFLFSLVKQHGEYVGPMGNSSASDAIAMGVHVGTHMDALCHFSCGGKFFDGKEIVQSYAGGVRAYSIDTIAPILRRGVLLDIAKLEDTDALPPDFEVTPAHLDAAVKAQGVEIQAGDIVLLRTGWAKYFRDPAKFISQVTGPGPAIDGAKWFSSREVYAVGSDTVAFEKVPDASMPVHVHLLVESGIHIIECLNLEQLARAKAPEFLFIALPLKIEGATGSPVRPIALVQSKIR